VLFTLGSIAMLTLAGGLIYTDLNGELERAIDDGLSSRVGDIAADVSAGSRVIREEVSFAQILGPDGQLIDTSSNTTAKPVLSPAEVARALQGELRVDRAVPDLPGLGDGARLLARPVPTPGGRVVVVAGASLDAVQRGRRRLALELALSSPLMAVLISAGGWLLAGAALRPVRRMSAEADAISLAHAGRRLAEPPGDDEIAQLGRTLNAMLDRIEAAFARERMFLDDASHELRTPISVLRGELELAMLEPGDPGAVQLALESALQEAERLGLLAEDLLVLARTASGRLPLRRSPVNVRQLAETVAGRLGRGPARVRVGGPEVVAALDPVRVEQVLANLVGNASRFARRELSVEVGKADDAVVIVVADDGPGFPPTLLPELVFDRFSRAEPSRARGSGGTGLGLAIAAGIVAAHGGTISARNGPPLGGAVVEVHLPADPVAVA
jgi:two-component system, OmpR family, sensor kinase